MGSDNYANFLKWKDSKYIINNFKICIYKRRGYSMDLVKNTIQLPGDYVNISSSDIRTNIGATNKIKSLNSNVLEYITKHSLYH